MERGRINGLLVISIFLIFLSSGVFALDAGTCDITLRSACVASEGNRIVMGLSSLTSAHGEFPDTGTYPYVLCCAFGTGVTTCTGSNKIIGLSSSTNAHAEAPLGTNYLTSVCYEDLVCISTSSNCGTGDALAYKLNVTSLSSLTNAHIGRINDYPNKICCNSAKFLLPCTLQSASWSTENALEGQTVRLLVNGSGTECDRVSLLFEIQGGSTPVKINATRVAFNGKIATSSWVAEYQKGCGLLGLSDCTYYFNATMIGDSTKTIKSSDPELKVTKNDIVPYCTDKTTCSDYLNQGECESDSSLCNLAIQGGLEGINCYDPQIFCSCRWNDLTSECEFGYSENPTDPCESGFTLCLNSITGETYCHDGDTCPPGTDPGCNSNAICESGEGCLCADCEGQQDSCVLGAICQDGACNSSTPSANVTCEYGFTLCLNPVTGITYCYSGNKCPDGEPSACNYNDICESGEGCTCADCADGSQDTCSDDTYCILGECSSVDPPEDLFGSCKITQTVLKDCNEDPAGYKTIRWSGTWLGTETSGAAYERCTNGGEGNVPCPAEVELPFFNYYGIAITLGVITIIYFFLISKKKLKRKKK
jgi:hypothetical protein